LRLVAPAWHNAAPLRIEENMSLRKLALACFLLSVFAFNSAAQSQPAPAKSADSPLAPVEWLVGGTWVSDVKDPQDGSVTHVENHITWAPNHQAIQFVTDFNSKPHYNGFYAYNAAAKTIGFYYTSESGQLTIGSSTPDPDGRTLHQEFDVMQPDGKTQHIRSTLERDGGDAYWFAVFMQDKAGEWAQVFKIRYERK
jgi:Protein of unknown function (DUF1579)